MDKKAQCAVRMICVAMISLTLLVTSLHVGAEMPDSGGDVVGVPCYSIGIANGDEEAMPASVEPVTESEAEPSAAAMIATAALAVTGVSIIIALIFQRETP